jgi:hypothetical protein
MTERVGRAWFAVTALVVAVGIVVQLFATADNDAGHFTGTKAVLNVFCYFTIQSNILLGVTSALLAIRTDRTSTVFRALRLDGVLAMVVTGIVYHTVLSGLDDLDGAAAFANLVLHTITPLLALLGWLLFGPRAQTNARIVGWSVVYPVLWLVFTLVRGPLAGDFYPYPFVDVAEHGLGKVLLNCLLVAGLFLGLGAGATALDRVLKRTRR